MLSPRTLSQTQDEIQNRVTSHALTLVELFRVTGAFVAADQHASGSLASTEKWAFNEDAFLSANDLQQGRIFDFSTLPSVPEPTRRQALRTSPTPRSRGPILDSSQGPRGPSVPTTDAPSVQGEHEAAPLPKKPRLDDTSRSTPDNNTTKPTAFPHGIEIPDSSVSPESTPPGTTTGPSISTAPTPPPLQPAGGTDKLEGETRSDFHDTGKQNTEERSTTETLVAQPEQQDQADGIATPPVAVDDKDQRPTKSGLGLPDTPATPGAQLRFEEALSIRNEQADESNRYADTTEDIAHPPRNDGAAQGSSNNDDGVSAPAAAQQSDQTTSAIEAADGAFVYENGRTKDVATRGLRNPAFAGIDESLTLSQRPPMRIDTGASVPNGRKLTSEFVGSPLKTGSTRTSVAQTSQPQTPRSAITPTPTHARRDRMTTRVSSGALGRKSVSEILGETPRTAPLPSDRPTSANRKEQGQEQASKVITSARTMSQPSPSVFRFPDVKEKERTKLSTVVFQGNKVTKELEASQQAQKEKAKQDPVIDDFLMPLFVSQANINAQNSLHSLVYSTHKTLSTADSRVDQDEQLNVRLLSKIYQLQCFDRWGLRQHERSQEPSRPTSHWDHLLSEMKFMRTDFREERKWKMAAARAMANSCAEWVSSPPEDRVALQVKVRSRSGEARSTPATTSTPDLIPSTEEDPSDVDDLVIPPRDILDTVTPAAVFSLPSDVFVFGMAKDDASDKILSELPLYEPSIASRGNKSEETLDPDSSWRKPIVPLSKYIEGKVSHELQEPVRKKSRYSYINDEKEQKGLDGLSRQASPSSMPSNDHPVALFDPVNKPIRERIQLSHAFRPPSEHPMPSQSFFEHRSPSQWTQSEDDDLRRYVREYAYNWSFISTCLSMPSRYTSGPERRTPWECFERWVTLEGLPNEMIKVPYFLNYQKRLAAAQRNYAVQQQAILQQQQANGAAQVTMRRQSTAPFLVDRRKSNKHLHIFDAMRKLHKKKEADRSKKEHVAQSAALRKAQEPQQPRNMTMTPAELSQRKYEREVYQLEQMRQFKAQVQRNRENARLQQQAQMSGSSRTTSMGRPPQVPGMSGAGLGPNGAPPNGQSSSMGHLRGGMAPSSRLANGVSVNGSTSISQSVPHAPMQPHMQMPQRVPSNMTNDMKRYHEAARQQADQQNYIIQQRLQQPQSNQQPGKSVSPNMANMSSAPHNPSMYAPMQNGRAASPAVNGNYAPNGTSASPRIGSSQPQPLSSGMVPIVTQMQQSVRSRNPGASPEQIKALTTEAMNSQYRLSQAQQAALQAAPASTVASMVSNNSNNMNGIGSSQSTTQQAIMNGTAAGGHVASSQQYAALIRQQQQQQQQQNQHNQLNNQHAQHNNRNSGAGMGGGGIGPPGSRGGTPQMHPGGASQSPRPASAQAINGQ